MLILLSIIGGMALLYMLMIMPQIMNKPDMMPFMGRLYAHRGLHDNASDAPENSLAAFRKAVEAGYGMELDIQLTKDNEVVVFHDATLNRVCGVDGRIRDYTYEELQQFRLCKSEEKIPKFTEVLELVSGRSPLIVEFKGDTTDLSLCPIADAILREYQGVYCMESFNPLMVAWYRKNHKEVVRGQLSEEFWKNGKKTVLNFVLQYMLLNFYAKPEFIAYDCKSPRALSRRLCCNFYGATAVAWTIKGEKELEEMQKYFELFIFDSFTPSEKWRENSRKEM
ncbi:MAG: glycerophosphodiester phosphodiesterase [Lachnospiraceae bacterium]|nr:glycerophosphodiester phosphodiesterase [Lachnospiraceae bacterium]